MRGLMDGCEPGIPYKNGADKSVLHNPTLVKPLQWTKPRAAFVCSMTDLLLPYELGGLLHPIIAQVFKVMMRCTEHLFLVLTKHPEEMRRFVVGVGNIAQQHGDFSWPLPNVWLGVTAENQEKARERIPILLDIPAAKRFVSCEPLLGPIDLKPWLPDIDPEETARKMGFDPRSFDAVRSTIAGGPVLATGIQGQKQVVDWVICGGESGQSARQSEVEWYQQIVSQCSGSGVPCFVKQLGRRPLVRDISPTGTIGLITGSLKLNHSKDADPDEWPADLRIQEFPV